MDSLSLSQALLAWKKILLCRHEHFLFSKLRRWGFSLWHFLRNNAMCVPKGPTFPVALFPALHGIHCRKFHICPTEVLSPPTTISFFYPMYQGINRSCLFPIPHSTCGISQVLVIQNHPRASIPLHGLARGLPAPEHKATTSCCSWASLTIWWI